MGRKMQLKITEPCHENWESMTPDDQGRFCGSCQKQVIDFSGMTDREMLEFFKKPSTGSVCGRFMNDQLERRLEPPVKRIPWVSYFFQILLPALFVTKVSAQRTMGKPVVQALSDTTRIPVRPEHLVMGMIIRTPVKQAETDTSKKNIFMINEGFINGKVIDQKGQPVPYASIDPGNGKARAADENGAFTIDAVFIKNGQSLRVSSVNFETRTVIIDKGKCLREGLQVQLETKAVLPEVVIRSYNNLKKCEYTLGAVSTRRTTYERSGDIDTPAKSTGLQVYPNPVAAGQSINISFDKLEEGYYTVQFVGINGQVIKQEEIWIDAEARVMNIKVPSMSAGICLLVLTNKLTGKKSTERIVVQ